MHELSIALRVVAVAAEEAARYDGARVVAVHLALGPLSGTVPEALATAFEFARADSPLAAARLVIEETPIAVHCPRCREDADVESILHLRCPRCGTPTAEVVSGRELEITSLELEEPP
ncbi:hydrogenase maturation nickel metallochaperone HypA [Alienimonas sp. DA493]|uniref:hydrogenase maturation nickel metallochaperone HypA/HybF n=1 Tax=Alienimonas sp. DA493 TaxID=3373605 RepID=UPI003754C999